MKTILFDFDGTIADSIFLILQIVNDVLKVYGYPEIDNKKFSEMRDNSLHSALKKLSISPFLLPFMFLHGRMLFRKRRDTIQPIDGIKKAIESLIEKEYKIGIISSNSRGTIDQFLEKNSFPFIDYKYNSINLFGKDKIIQNCLEQHAINKRDAIYIGDEVRDIEASHKNGIKCISVTWGFNSKKSLEIAKPNLVVEKVDDLVSKIDIALNEKSI